MFTLQTLTALAATIYLTHLTNALPQAATAAPYPNSDLYTWSADDTSCKTAAPKSDCQSAFAQICSPNKDLSKHYQVTVGQCTAIFWVDPNNSVPSQTQCTAAFTQIFNAGIGGALGYNSAGARTTDPLYVLYPTNSGTGNCFKKAGDTSAVTPANILPNGNSIYQFGSCDRPSTQKRALDTRQSPNTNTGASCSVDASKWGQTCSSLCLAQVTAPSPTNPFATTAGLTCFGGCEQIAYNMWNDCMNNQGTPDPSIFGGGKSQQSSPAGSGVIHTKAKRASSPVNSAFVAGLASANVCMAIGDQLSFDCPAVKNALLAYHSCATAGGADGVGAVIHT